MAVLPPDGFPTLPLDLWRLLEERVGEYEAALARGERPDVAAYLLDPDPTSGQLLVELVYADLDFRLRSGESARVDDYLAAFPELAARADDVRRLRAYAREQADAYAREQAAAKGGRSTERRDYDPTELTSLPALDELVARFERAFEAGRRPRVEDFVSQVPEKDRPAAFERLSAAEAAARGGRGGSPRPEESAGRLPEGRDRSAGEGPADGPGSTVVAPPGPRRFGRFELLEQLGTGGFGAVWKAKDPTLDRVVAVKILHPHRLGAGGTGMFLREARAAAQLRHPNIVAIHEVRADGEAAYIVYDYVEGVSLQDWMAAERPSFREAAELCRRLAAAVQHAHDREVIHRDLKPANVLVDRSGAAHVTDFGLAKRTAAGDTSTRDGLVMGSLPYMSPEQAAGRSNAADARTDVYGLGMILYELLTGRRPFEGGEAVVLRKILTEDPPAPRRVRKAVPRDLETVCLKAIAKEPSRRYMTAAELAGDLERFLRGEPVRARRAGWHKRGWRFVRRQPALVTAAALLALVPPAVFLAVPERLPTPAEEPRRPRVAPADDGPAPAETVGTPLWFPGDADRAVEIVTDPPGARVWMFPIDRRNGWPRPEDRIDAPRVAPARVNVPPGEYLIVGDFGDGRFNEVRRWVPRAEEFLPMNAAPLYWKRLDDGAIELRFDVPEPPDGLIPIEPVVPYRPEAGTASLPVDIPPYFISRRAFSVGDFKRLGVDLPRGVDPSLGDDDPIPLAYDQAAGVLELFGLRLPDEFELEYAARISDDGSEGPDGRPLIDFSASPAEWTSSWSALPPGFAPPLIASLGPANPDLRVVRGADPSMFGTNPASAAFSFKRRHELPRLTQHPRLAFRGVRSARPRRLPEDFVRLRPAEGR